MLINGNIFRLKLAKHADIIKEEANFDKKVVQSDSSGPPQRVRILEENNVAIITAVIRWVVEDIANLTFILSSPGTKEMISGSANEARMYEHFGLDRLFLDNFRG